jgi:hypothetical protein
MLRSVFACLILTSAVIAATAPGPVTFNRDVLPVLQKQCQTCHRPGEVAPMSFLSYKETRPWARAIKEAILTGKMPPWFADPKYGHFVNERRLSDVEVKSLVAWADGGALEGDAKDAPPPLQFAGGWTIGKPDIVIQFPHEIPIQATGAINQSNLLVKVNFPKDLWVKAAEVRPGNPRAVHHMKAWIRPPGSDWLKDAPEGELYNPRRGTVADFSGMRAAQGRGGAAAGPQSPSLQQDMLAKYNPGVEGQEFAIGGAAKFIPAGSDIVFECHYNATGKPETDRSSVGIVLASGPPEQRYVTTTGVNNASFVIPPQDPHYEVKAQATVQQDVKLVWLQPHMHLRAADYEIQAVYPSGESEILLKVPTYSFAWQIGYEFAKPVLLPKGTRLETITHYDNSPNNPFNPDPNKAVSYGPQSWDEMDLTFVGYIVDVKADRGRVFLGPPGRRATAPPPLE